MLVENIGPFLWTALPIILLSSFINLVLPALRVKWHSSYFPIVNKRKDEWFDTNAVKRCASSAPELLREGYEKVGSDLME